MLTYEIRICYLHLVTNPVTMLKAWCLASFPCLPRYHNWEIVQNPKMHRCFLKQINSVRYRTEHYKHRQITRGHFRIYIQCLTGMAVEQVNDSNNGVIDNMCT